MSLDETKENIEWLKRAIEYKSSYVIKNQAKMIYLHDIEIKNIAEFNWRHDIINTPKHAKI